MFRASSDTVWGSADSTDAGVGLDDEGGVQLADGEVTPVTDDVLVTVTGAVADIDSEGRLLVAPAGGVPVHEGVPPMDGEVVTSVDGEVVTPMDGEVVADADAAGVADAVGAGVGRMYHRPIVAAAHTSRLSMVATHGNVADSLATAPFPGGRTSANDRLPAVPIVAPPPGAAYRYAERHPADPAGADP